MNATIETCDEKAVCTIVAGRFQDCCRAIGAANLPTVLKAESRLAVEPVSDRLRIVRQRRIRLESEARQRREQHDRPATIRI